MAVVVVVEGVLGVAGFLVAADSSRARDRSKVDLTRRVRKLDQGKGSSSRRKSGSGKFLVLHCMQRLHGSGSSGS